MLTLQYVKVYLLEILRNKSAAFFTIIFPTLLLLLFGKQGDTTSLGQTHMLIAMSNYAVQSSMFLSLGMSIAFSRCSKWTEYMRTLPVPSYYNILGQIIAMSFFAIASLLLVVVVGVLWLNVHLNFQALCWMIVASLLGGIPMGFLGVVIAYLVNEVAARSVFLILNLLLFFSSFSLPTHGIAGYFRFFVPSYQWFSLSSSLTLHQPIEFICLYGLLAYTVIFYLLSVQFSRKA